MSGSTFAGAAARADALRALHHAPDPLVLPNAWDVASARAVAARGFPAVATSSGGVAAALGYADGEAMPADDAFAAIARIAGAVETPVTADVESGYGLRPRALSERLVEAGAAGCNLEDSDHARGGLADARARRQTGSASSPRRPATSASIW